MFTPDSFEYLLEFEFSTQSYIASSITIGYGSAGIFTPYSVELELEIEFSPESYLGGGVRAFSQVSIEIDQLIEFASNYQTAVNLVKTFDIFNPAIEINLLILPPTEGEVTKEIVWDISQNIFLTLGDILDVLNYQGDIRLILEDGEGKLNIKQNDLERDAGLETAFLISLFTDQRATAEDLDKDGLSDLRGWWADQFAEDEGDQTGSFLWLLERAKIDSTILARAQDYSKKCLQWAVEDGVVKDIAVEASRDGLEGVAILLSATRPKNDEKVVFKYFYNWRAQELRRVG